MDEYEFIRINPSTGSVQKSKTKVTDSMHNAARLLGSVEIPPTSVVYKHAGKMYMFNAADAANNQAAINFQSHFDDDY
jgi:hypothetical protein